MITILIGNVIKLSLRKALFPSCIKMRNNRESLILFVLIIFLIVKNYQSDSSSYKFTAELNHWKRNNYAREDIEEPFTVFDKEGGSEL